MAKLVVGIAFAGLLMIALVSPMAMALVGETPTRWDFKFDENGVWHATGDHVSFSWTLKPFEVYDLTVDGVMLIEELSFPADADAYTTQGGVFKVMMGHTTLFSIHDNPTAAMQAECVIAPIDSCDIGFPEGSEVMTMAAGKNDKMRLFHVEYPEATGTIRPCGTLGIRGDVSIDGSMVMFSGDLRLHYPVGQSMVLLG
jgi:hypothetical protein